MSKQPIVVDFESYYDNTLSASDMGVRNYVDKSYAYMVALAGDQWDWVGTIEEAQREFPRAFWEDNQFWAANSVFDETWARKVFDVGDMGPWKCILDRGAVNQYGQSVPLLVRGLFGTKVDKETRDMMKGVHYGELPDDKKRRVLDYCLNDAREEWNCLLALPEPSGIEDRIAAYTRMTNQRGVRIDRELVERDLEALRIGGHEAKYRIPWIEAKDAPGSPLELEKWCQHHGIPVPNSRAQDDAECDRLMAEHPKLAAVIGDIRTWQKCNRMVKKGEGLLDRLDKNDVLGMELMYCGARHTRRWSSRGFNIQNLDAKPFDIGGASVDPRRWIIPRPGKVFLIFDFAQIEPRCLNWLVGNNALLDLIRQGFGIYEAYARSAHIWSGGAPLKSANPSLYKTVKAQVLGLGYGMGVDKFIDQARGEGVELDREAGKAAVDDWRSRNAGITRLWRVYDQLIHDAVRATDNTIELEMPTGDVLRHFHIRASRQNGFESYTTRSDFGPGSKQNRLWGGVLVENVTQRMARDVMAEAVLALEAAGLPCPFTAHDEIIMEVDDDEATRKEAWKTAEEIMTRPPEWAPGLPLAVEGEFHLHYTK